MCVIAGYGFDRNGHPKQTRKTEPHIILSQKTSGILEICQQHSAYVSVIFQILRPFLSSVYVYNNNNK